jgi:hypothetical protein
MNKKRSDGPCVGIWWVDGRRLIAFARPINALRPEAGYVNYPHGHAALWPFVQRRHVRLRGKEYWQVPRGRVVRVALDRWFHVLLPDRFASDAWMIARLVRRYGLPQQRVRVLADLHYDERAADD